jgi:hypothetical protein
MEALEEIVKFKVVALFSKNSTSASPRVVCKVGPAETAEAAAKMPRAKWESIVVGFDRC